MHPAGEEEEQSRTSPVQRGGRGGAEGSTMSGGAATAGPTVASKTAAVDDARLACRFVSVNDIGGESASRPFETQPQAECRLLTASLTTARQRHN
jgi:hypothetical protein